ncbi:hypothetical protein T06_2892 [Trichinella sp. T6]|nr:hypothetical protein T06_2892 [Trichinella sp. T6]
MADLRSCTLPPLIQLLATIAELCSDWCLEFMQLLPAWHHLAKQPFQLLWRMDLSSDDPLSAEIRTRRQSREQLTLATGRNSTSYHPATNEPVHPCFWRWLSEISSNDSNFYCFPKHCFPLLTLLYVQQTWYCGDERQIPILTSMTQCQCGNPLSPPLLQFINMLMLVLQ